ncbi:MAG: ATP-binding protein [Rhodocyclaceae bacterium]
MPRERQEGTADAARPPWSLRARLLAVSLAVLLGFVVLTGYALDRAFRGSADAAQSERLEATLYLLMGALELGGDGMPRMPPALPEARLATPGSGLYAAVARNDGDGRWLSDSAVSVAVAWPEPLAPGASSDELRVVQGATYRVVARGVRWAIGDVPVALTFALAAPLASQGEEVAAYRRELWASLAVMAGLLLAALVAVQHWGLRPLRTLARRVAQMEAGERRALGGPYPRELAPLAANLDRLLARERETLERHRKALGDLAHSLKTPLAVLRGAPPDASLPGTVQEQTRVMDDIVHYQLQRAATAGASRSAPPLAVAPLVERLLATMRKVHAARALTLTHAIDPALGARIDEGDALELLGNLIDNACKWAATTVTVRAERREGGLVVCVEDDGPGIAEPQRLALRGQRGDERTPGHGIGLAIVGDIALAYGGELRFGRATLGGAKVEVWLSQC